RAGKFAEELARRRKVGRMGSLRGREGAEVNSSSVAANLCTPLLRTAREIDALVSGGIVPRTTPVGVVLRTCRQPQIVPPVVGGISVAVVDRWFAPPSGHVEPRQLIFVVPAAIDLDVPTILLPRHMSG